MNHGRNSACAVKNVEVKLIEEKTDYKLQDGVCRITVKWECKEEIGMRNTEQTAD